MTEDNLTKIHVELPNNDDVGGESFWAENLGENLYRLRNIPFHAYGINFFDIVYTKSESDDLKPSIIKVHEQGGHKTLRVIFLDDATVENRIMRLKILNEHKGYHENANGTLFAIDVEPEGDYGTVCDILQSWEDDGVLSYETCEARNKGSFDAE